MPQTQRSQVQPVKLRCRFEMTAADAPSSHEFCVFEFPGCEGCPKAQHTVRTVGSSEDPMKSEALRAWVAGAFRSNQGGQLWRSTFTGRTLPCSRKVSLNRRAGSIQYASALKPDF